MREGDAVLFNFDLRHINANVWYTNVCHAPAPAPPFGIFVEAISFNCTCLSTKAASFSVSQRPPWLAEDSPATATPTPPSRFSCRSGTCLINLHTLAFCVPYCLAVCARVCVCVRLSWRDKVNFTVQTRVIKCNNSELGAPHRLQIVCLPPSLSLPPSPSSSPSACV